MLSSGACIGKIIAFNLIPLVMIAAGWLDTFDVMAFYWVEVWVVGAFALLRLMTCLGWRVVHNPGSIMFHHFSSIFMMPLHFGFMMVMMCFAIGLFLPEDTPVQTLTGPLVPMKMVVSHIDFRYVLPPIVVWYAVDFFVSFIRTRAYTLDRQAIDPVLGAYGHMMTLFCAAMAGMVLAGVMNERLWGPAVLVFLKIGIDVAAQMTRGQMARMRVPAEQDGKGKNV